MPLQATSGAVSYDGFGGGVPIIPNYIEEVFSTYLYTGTGTSDYQAITNNINLTLYKGLVWIKRRDTTGVNGLYDSVRDNTVRSNTTAAQGNNPAIVSGVSTTGFSTGNSADANTLNGKYASWTFRKQPKFFDIVTYTGTGANTTIAHNLGSVPGMVLVKSTNNNYAWAVYHRSLANTQYLVLNTTAAVATGATYWNSTTPTSAVFSVGTDTSVNGAGVDYVAYVFAHDAGGFGLTGTDNVISCGTFTGNTTVNLGFEPQWILLKNSGSAEDWYIHDTMRGWPVSGDAKVLFPNLSSAESGTAQIFPNATGFTTSIGGGTYIYMAIRRGPMKVPTTGTNVFMPIARAGTGVTTIVTGVGFPSDLIISRQYTDNNVAGFFNRLIGPSKYLATPGDVTLRTGTNSLLSFNMDGMTVGSDVGAPDYIINRGEGSYINYFFRRCPSVFDTVCDIGTGSAHTISHNLGVVPELILRKETSPDNTTFIVYAGLATSFLNLGTSQASQTASDYWNNTSPTSSVFTVGTNPTTNQSGDIFISNLFATCPGVSKVGSYTGTGTTQTINCGFTAGARFVLIKRTDSTGDWYVWDSARGIVAGNDPYFLLNTTAAGVTSTDYIDTASTGFEISSTAPAAINASGGTFIFLAIA